MEVNNHKYEFTKWLKQFSNMTLRDGKFINKQQLKDILDDKHKKKPTTVTL